MVMRTPAFWSNPRSVRGRLLGPLGALYAGAGRVRRCWTTPVRLPVPVICVGNVVAGGSGKTPTALALHRLLADRAVAAHFLSRGYGGRLRGPVQVDPQRHGAADVGDEPLLLAATGPAWISADRAAGGQAATAAGAAAVILDDGLQNPTLHQDLPLMVVDAGALFGNGRVIPAGPLRERLAPALARAAAVIVIGDDPEVLALVLGGFRPTLAARLRPDPAVAARLAGRRVVGFAGIGRPAKFFETLAGLGAAVCETRPFPDHHRYSDADLRAVLETAAARDAVAVTTAKDWVRLPPDPTLRAAVTVLPVTLAWDDPAAVTTLLAPLFPALADRTADDPAPGSAPVTAC